MIPDDDEGQGEEYPNTLGSADGDVHFAGDAQSFLLHWVDKLGVDPTGAALLIGEGPSITILHPETGEVLSCKEIAKRAKAPNVRSVP